MVGGCLVGGWLVGGGWVVGGAVVGGWRLAIGGDFHSWENGAQLLHGYLAHWTTDPTNPNGQPNGGPNGHQTPTCGKHWGDGTDKCRQRSDTVTACYTSALCRTVGGRTSDLGSMGSNWNWRLSKGVGQLI